MGQGSFVIWHKQLTWQWKEV